MNHQDLERDLSQRLRELSESAAEPPWHAAEQRLLRAFAGHQVRAASRQPTAGRRRARTAIWRIAAAAVVVLAAAITFYPRPEPRHVAPPQPAEAPGGVAHPPPTASGMVKPVPRPRPTSKEPSSKAPTRTRHFPPARPATTAAAADRPSSFADFVALPGASALPDFESGRIMRIEIPLTGLPAYGLDMVLDAAPGTIEADVLVGQDGVPRAIRLASTESL